MLDEEAAHTPWLGADGKAQVSLEYEGDRVTVHTIVVSVQHAPNAPEDKLRELVTQVVYDDKFAYSHHATDPSSGRLCNAFDLVRWHLFTPGSKTEDGTVIDSDQKSIAMMREYASNDEATRKQLAQERI